MTGRTSSLNTYLLLGLAMLFWAGNSVVGRAVRLDVPPFTLSFVRWTLAVCVVLPLALPRLRHEWRVAAKGWGWILVLGLVGVAGFNGFLYKGLHHTSATNALLLQAAIPAMVAAFDRLLFGVRVSRLHAVGVVASTLGVIWIVARGDLATLGALRFGAGDLLVLAAVTAWSLYTVLLRCRPAISPISFLFLTFVIAALAMAPLAAGEWAAGGRVRWGWPVIGAFAYVGLLPSVVAYFIYNHAIERLGPARAGQAITLMPLFGAILPALLLGEQLASYHLAGVIMILAGIVLSALSLRSRVRDQTGGIHADRSLEDCA